MFLKNLDLSEQKYVTLLFVERYRSTYAKEL